MENIGEQVPTTQDPLQQQIELRLRTQNQFKAGANWFYWIAGLSLVNSVISFGGSNWSFIVGLGVTQFIEAIGSIVAEELGASVRIVAFAFSVAAAGVFAVFGFLARKHYTWAFIAGMSLYALDGLLFLLVGDIFSLGFHVFALFCIYSGLKALRKLAEMDQVDIPAPPPQTAVPQDVSV